MSELAKALGPTLYQQVVDEAQAREVPVRAVLRWCVERGLPLLVPLDQPWTRREP